MGLKLIVYPNDMLQKKVTPVKDFGVSLQKALEQMKKILQKQQGLGLAAPQVDWDAQCFLVKYEDAIHTFINPQLLFVGNEMISHEEGCLSIPGVYAEVLRPREVHVQAQNAKGEVFEKKSVSFFARIILHEYDHLQGILFVDHLSKRMCSRILKEYTILQEQKSNFNS